MPLTKVVFVVGAGASTDVGLMVGQDFKYDVADRISTVDGDILGQRLKDIQIQTAVEKLASENSEGIPIEHYFDSCRKIIESTPAAASIDSVLEIHQNDLIATIVGKMAIVRSILEAEKASDLYIDDEKRQVSLNLKGIENTWYMSLFRFLCGSLPFDSLEASFGRVTLVVFNYDRCIEYFLYHSLRQHYHQGHEAVSDLLKHHLKIIHPFGTVGSFLPDAESKSVKYGNVDTSDLLIGLAQQIYTYNEAVDAEEGQKVNEIRQSLQEAAKIVFLGYAFHEQNMRLIKPNEPGQAWFIASTNRDNSASNCHLIRELLRRSFAPDQGEGIYYEKALDCSALFKEYELKLA